jgi:hypothetical protein
MWCIIDVVTNMDSGQATEKCENERAEMNDLELKMSRSICKDCNASKIMKLRNKMQNDKCTIETEGIC